MHEVAHSLDEQSKKDAVELADLYKKYEEMGNKNPNDARLEPLWQKLWKHQSRTSFRSERNATDVQFEFVKELSWMFPCYDKYLLSHSMTASGTRNNSPINHQIIREWHISPFYFDDLDFKLGDPWR